MPPRRKPAGSAGKPASLQTQMLEVAHARGLSKRKMVLCGALSLLSREVIDGLRECLARADRTRLAPSGVALHDMSGGLFEVGEDWLWRPVIAGLCRYVEVIDGTLDIADLARMNALLDAIEPQQPKNRRGGRPPKLPSIVETIEADPDLLTASAKSLAERFGISLRTVRRAKSKILTKDD